MRFLETRFGQKLLTFARGSGVGVVASLLDLLALTFLVRVLALPETAANIPALLVGVSVQFVGARYLVFRTSKGEWRKQLAGFALAEAGTFLLNAIAFHILVAVVHIHFVPARVIASFLVFVAFSFPMWRLVFERDAQT